MITINLPKLMLEELEPEMLNLMLKSNATRTKEMKDPNVAAETKKVAKRVSEFEGEQDKQIMC